MNVTESSTSKQLFDADEVRRTLQLLMPAGQVTELRLLEASTRIDGWPHTASGYFDDGEKLLASLEAVRAAKAIYLIPNPVNSALLARAANRLRKAGKGETTSDKDIQARRWLLIDCDPVRPAGISSTEGEHAAALERCEAIRTALHFNYGWPEPIVADSGNGGHLLYRVELPVDDGGLVQRCLESLAGEFSDEAVKVDTGVFNPARIWKLYGTAACKGDSTADRPHRLSRLLEVPDLLVPISRELLESLASEAPTPQATNGTTHGSSSSNGVFDIDAFIQRQHLEVDGPDAYQGGRKWTFKTSPLCDHHDDGPYLIQFGNGALAAGCHHDSCGWTWHDLRAKLEPKMGSDYAEWFGRTKASTNGEANGSTAEKPAALFTRITSAELDSGDYSIEFAIEGAMALGQPLTIGGPMKVLKTSILIDAAVSLASGGYFLGRLKVNQPRQSLVMSGESGLATIQETARRIADAAGMRLANLDRLIWSSDIPKLNRPDHLEGLDRMLAADGIEVLFLDPAYLAMPSADAGNLMAQGELLRNIGELCQRRGVTLVLCHHTKRNTGQDAYEPLELQHLAWAGHAEFARQWWLVNRRERYEPGSGDHRLWLSVGGSAGHSALWALDISEGTLASDGGRWWDVSLDDAANAREATAERKQQAKQQNAAARLEAYRKAICEALASYPDATQTKSLIKSGSGLNTSQFDPAFASLIREKRIVPATITKGNKQTYEAFTLATS